MMAGSRSYTTRERGSDMASDDRYRVLNLLSQNRKPFQADTEGPPIQRGISRREWLQRASTGMAAGLASGGLGKSLAGPSGKTPFSLIIDDGSPVDPLF